LWSFDRLYAEKADGRSGGVGKETQIITSEIYEQVDQGKFVGVIAERDQTGKPFQPAFYRNRIYIDLSTLDVYASNFDQLLRWLFDKPLYVKSPIGRRPGFLDEETTSLATATRARRALEQIRQGATNSAGSLRDYLDVLSVEMIK